MPTYIKKNIKKIIQIGCEMTKTEKVVKECN